MRGIRIPETGRARQLRKAQTEGERLLWLRLRGRGLNGHKFVRQEPTGPYFADFACRDSGLIIEVDGATHSNESERGHDERRTDFLNARGYRVVRVANDDIFHNLDGVLETILTAIGEASTNCSSGARGEG
jgi:very-short-patch-repair endonuclease